MEKILARREALEAEQVFPEKTQTYNHHHLNLFTFSLFYSKRNVFKMKWLLFNNNKNFNKIEIILFVEKNKQNNVDNSLLKIKNQTKIIV